MTRTRLRHRAPDVLLFGGMPVILLRNADWGSAWAGQVGVAMFAIGTLWLLSRTMRIRADRRFDPSRHRSDFSRRRPADPDRTGGKDGVPAPAFR